MTVRTLAEAAAEILAKSKAANINEADYQELGGSSFENPEGTENLGAKAAAAVTTLAPPGPAPVAGKDPMKKLAAQVQNSVKAKVNPPAGTDSGAPTATAGNPVATYEETELSDEELDEYLDSLTEEELNELASELDEEADQVEEARKPSNAEARVEFQAGTPAVIRKQHEKIYKKLVNQDPDMAERFRAKWVPHMKPMVSEDQQIENEQVEELSEEELLAIQEAKRERIKNKMKEVSCKEDIDALFNGEELSEEFREKVTTIFEAAVIARATMVVEEMEEEILVSAEETVEEIKAELEEQVDSYLNYMVEEWVNENRLAINSGIKEEIQESFISGLKNLFAEHYINVPEEKYDMVEAMTQQIQDLNDKLNESMNTNIELAKAITESRKNELQTAVCEGLTATQAAKVKTLAEGVEFTTEGEYTRKLNIIRENYFAGDNSTKVKQANPVALTESEGPVQSTEEVSSAMESYMRAISRTLPK